MPLRDDLQANLRTAMRAGDRDAASLYRTTLAAIANAEAVPLEDRTPAGAIEQAPLGVGAAEVPRRELTEDQVAAIVRHEVEERRVASRVTGLPESRWAQLTRHADHLEALLRV